MQDRVPFFRARHRRAGKINRSHGARRNLACISCVLNSVTTMQSREHWLSNWKTHNNPPTQVTTQHNRWNFPSFHSHSTMTFKHHARARNSHQTYIYFGYLSLPFCYFINVLTLFIFLFFRSNTNFVTVQFQHIWIHSKPTPTSHNVSKSVCSPLFKVITQRDVFAWDETQSLKSKLTWIRWAA